MNPPKDRDALMSVVQRSILEVLLWGSATEAARAALAAIEAAGVALVPVVATDAMKASGVNMLADGLAYIAANEAEAAAIYRAMIAASPYAPEARIAVEKEMEK